MCGFHKGNKSWPQVPYWPAKFSMCQQNRHMDGCMWQEEAVVAQSTCRKMEQVHHVCALHVKWCNLAAQSVKKCLQEADLTTAAMRLRGRTACATPVPTTVPPLVLGTGTSFGSPAAPNGQLTKPHTVHKTVCHITPKAPVHIESSSPVLPSSISLAQENPKVPRSNLTYAPYGNTSNHVTKYSLM